MILMRLTNVGRVLRAPEKPASDPVAVAPDHQNDEYPEPYGGKGLHLTGRISMRGSDVWTFAVSNNGQRIASVDSRDLIKAGYKWEPLTDCAGMLRWGHKIVAVNCDAPALNQGSNDKPVVLEMPAGSSSPTGSSVPGYVERTAPAVPESSGSTLGDVARSFRG